MTTKKKSKSARADGRGGWPAGKRRHPDVGDWTRLRIQLAAMIADRPSRGPTGVNNVAIGAACGVGEKSVRRWLTGEDRPSPEAQEAIRQWLKEKRMSVKERAEAACKRRLAEKRRAK
jgi:hypothetical protein